MSEARPPSQTGQPASPRDDHRSLAEAAAGAWIEVDGTGGASGVILKVLGSGPHEHLRVRWDEQHESLLYPAEQGFAIHAAAGAGSR